MQTVLDIEYVYLNWEMSLDELRDILRYGLVQYGDLYLLIYLGTSEFIWGPLRYILKLWTDGTLG